MHCAAFLLLFNHSRAVRIVGEIWGTAVSKLTAYDSLYTLYTLLDMNPSNRTSATDTLSHVTIQICEISLALPSRLRSLLCMFGSVIPELGVKMQRRVCSAIWKCRYLCKANARLASSRVLRTHMQQVDIDHFSKGLSRFVSIGHVLIPNQRQLMPFTNDLGPLPRHLKDSLRCDLYFSPRMRCTWNLSKPSISLIFSQCYQGCLWRKGGERIAA